MPAIAHLSCITCAHRVGSDGVYIASQVWFCRSCAKLVQAAIEVALAPVESPV